MNESDLDDIKELEWKRNRAAVELAESVRQKKFYENATDEYRKVIEEKIDSKLSLYVKAARDFQDALESY